MTLFSEYSKKYSMIEMRREDGILEMRFHTDGGPLRWSLKPHGELEKAFLDVGRDRENQVVILTGTGDEFSGPRVGPEGHNHKRHPVTPEEWDHIYWESKHLQMNLLNIEVPVISAINGPAYRHAEIPLLSDIVIAAEHSEFQDSAHFIGGLLPGDGVHIVFPHLMGINRARYFLLTGQTINSSQALAYGLVNEVLPKDQVLPRAWEHARQLMLQTTLLRRYSRVLLTHELKRKMHDLLGYGLALEGLAAAQQPA
ncbi:MAG: enoyl-CoA hydratase/isomerase family protein [Burkholderiaceae bacterium]|nr:enoyl-CoA hydratase/isomerase family protein [Burkholderiaceae bacterium]